MIRIRERNKARKKIKNALANELVVFIVHVASASRLERAKLSRV